MSLVARHKRAGGFRKLVNSIETTPPDKRAKILEAMRKEDPDFISEVENSVFSFEDFLKISDLIIGDIIDALKTEPKTWALALYHSDVTLVEKFTKNMRPDEYHPYKEALEMLPSVLAREQLAARFRIISKARELESRHKFVLKKYSPVFDTSV